MVMYVPNAAPAAPAKAERPASFVWLNIGIMDGDEFVSLPYGLPLDTMKPRAETGQNVAFVAGAKASNALQARLLEVIAENIEAGQTDFLENLVIQVRVASQPLEIAPEDNPHMSVVSKVDFGLSKKVAAPAEAAA